MSGAASFTKRDGKGQSIAYPSGILEEKV